jgi:hypothetical protein
MNNHIPQAWWNMMSYFHSHTADLEIGERAAELMSWECHDPWTVFISYAQELNQ